MADLEKYSTIPATRRSFNRLLAENRLLRMAAIIPDFVSIVDNSTGDDEEDYVEIPTLRTPFVHVTGSDLAQKSAFDTAVGTANNAIAVLKGILNQIGTPLEIGLISGGNGTVAVAGTVPAVTKSITGADGSSATVVSRSGANGSFRFLRDSMSTLILAHNRIADALGHTRIMDIGGGTASSTLALTNPPSTGDAVDDEGDTMSKAFADATMTKVANNIAILTTKIDALMDYVTAQAFVFPEPET